MITIYFVRDGCGSSATDAGRKTSLVLIAKAFENQKVIWSKNPPTFDGHLPANDVSAYRYVVIHIEGGETAGKFIKDGYWLLDGVSPAEFEQAIRPS